jgi:hypothetical protein
MSETINEILSEIATQLDITESQKSAVERAYNGMADWLNQTSASIDKHDIIIFPQGSIKLGTVVKPINEDDYDVDLVCLFTENFIDKTPDYVKQSIGKRIAENEMYKKMLLTEGKRCWTLQYSDSLNFHMDILPATKIVESEKRKNNNLIFLNTEAIKATEKDKSSGVYNFIPTNPHGYAEWFRRQMVSPQQLLLERGSVEKIPAYPAKTVLQKGIQILKRHRDVMFKDDPQNKPISIIITTLMALCYTGETNLLDFIIKSLNNMTNYIEIDNNGYKIVRNPVMSNENFADKWTNNPKNEKNFYKWISQAKLDFEKIANLEGIDKVAAHLKTILSEKVVDRALNTYGENKAKQRNAGFLAASTSTGILSSSGAVTVKPHTFYGEISKK